jgi:hypothetical protein
VAEKQQQPTPPLKPRPEPLRPSPMVNEYGKLDRLTKKT